jgi:hypothetical protein
VKKKRWEDDVDAKKKQKVGGKKVNQKAGTINQMGTIYCVRDLLMEREDTKKKKMYIGVIFGESRQKQMILSLEMNEPKPKKNC